VQTCWSQQQAAKLEGLERLAGRWVTIGCVEVEIKSKSGIIIAIANKYSKGTWREEEEDKGENRWTERSANGFNAWILAERLVR
jgi:hypothetical protein